MIRLEDVEHWAYTATHIQAVNRYYTAIHRGPNQGWAIVKGDQFSNPSMLRAPRELPVSLKQTRGVPMLVTESTWVMAGGYATEAEPDMNGNEVRRLDAIQGEGLIRFRFPDARHVRGAGIARLLARELSHWHQGSVNHDNASERVSRVIFEYAARIGQEQDTDALLRLNADMARDLVNADRCSIWLLDAGGQQLYTKVAHGVEEIRVNVGDGLVGACVARSEPVLVNDTSNDERFLNRIDHSSGYATNSVLVIPLRIQGGKVIGAFQALNKSGGFTDSDVALLGVAGSYSAAAIETQRLRKEAESARVLMRELEIATEVQAALLPQHLPTLHGVDCAAFFRPAKLLGGDYYDFTDTPGGVLAFTLGDVSGKGIPAAVLMASIQASLRLSLHNGTESLSDLVTAVNESVYASSQAGRYSTLFCALLNPATRRLTYVNAGQCSPMLVRRNEPGVRIERLVAGGTPVGLLPVASYEEGTVELQPGDTLVCFSDGISEATNLNDEFWPESDMESLLCANAGSSARAITDAVVRAADAFAGEAEQADDMTIVTLRVV